MAFAMLSPMHSRLSFLAWFYDCQPFLFGDSKFPLNISTSHLIVLPIVPESCCLRGEIGTIKFTNVVCVTFP